MSTESHAGVPSQSERELRLSTIAALDILTGEDGLCTTLSIALSMASQEYYNVSAAETSVATVEDRLEEAKQAVNTPKREPTVALEAVEAATSAATELRRELHFPEYQPPEHLDMESRDTLGEFVRHVEDYLIYTIGLADEWSTVSEQNQIREARR